jgi:ectoine hydroxylase-related dioxygenase (phytanoyl-CoA dioxygenase family)
MSDAGACVLPRLDRGAQIGDVLACLRESGACIVEQLVDKEQVLAINAQLAGPVADTPCSPFAGPGNRTRRTGSLVVHSPAAHAMISHPLIIGAATELLAPRSGQIQLAVTQHICVEPGEMAGGLHRDDCAWDLPPFAEPREVEVSTLWALDDFHASNGATLMAPASHRSGAEPEQFSSSLIPAEMPAGSVAIYTGRFVHGSGANRTDRPRRAAHVTYCTDWLRQKENQFLCITPEIARNLSPQMQALVGYAMGGFMLGYTRNFEDPRVAIDPGLYLPLGG